MPQDGGKSHMVHISDVKYIMPADSIIQHLPDFNKLGRKTKYNLNPDHIPDLSWQLATTLSTNPVSTMSFSNSSPQMHVIDNFKQIKTSTVKIIPTLLDKKYIVNIKEIPIHHVFN